ncbi:Uncharacterised protein [Bordetella pertussis]|nr:Uncharacterised protein [Bordetella pertussis]
MRNATVGSDRTLSSRPVSQLRYWCMASSMPVSRS